MNSTTKARVAIALDGGTTNTRARLLRDDHVVATAHRALGVRDAVTPEGRAALLAAIGDCIADVRHTTGLEPDRIVAAGMLSSEVGLRHVPHVEAPAGLDELAKGLVIQQDNAIAEVPIAIVPGVRTRATDGPDGWADADVMRGEECQVLGVWQTLYPDPGSAPARSAFLWIGSHTKLIELDGDGRITRSHTTLAGELLAAVADHTLIKASLPQTWPEAPEPTALEAGARLARRDGIARAAFLVRVADLTRHWNEAQRAAFWLGAVSDEDIRHLARHPILQAEPGTSVPVWVGGRQPRRDLYTNRFAQIHPGTVMSIDDELNEWASALGALAVARRHFDRP